MKHIIKRHGKEEHFDAKKIYGSCYAACIAAGTTHLEAEKLCERVTKELKKWVENKQEITSTQIFKQVIKILRKYHKEGAFMYETHRDIA